MIGPANAAADSAATTRPPMMPSSHTLAPTGRTRRRSSSVSPM